MLKKIWFLVLVPILLPYCFITCCSGSAITTLTNLTAEQFALLTLKSHITSHPQNFLANNWSASTSCCNWIGVTCGGRRQQRVTALNLSNMGITSTIPPQLGNLSFLTSFDIANNNFHGHLPDDFALLHRLKLINLGSNNFIQQIPSWFDHLPNLETLNLSNNGFSGTFPPSLFKCKQIKVLSLSYNYFTGSIPREIGNSSKLQVLYLGDNNFRGEIPHEMGNLVDLKILSMRNNGLTGPIPSAIFNISSMEILSLALNNLSSSLPADIMFNHLKALSLASNELRGPIPSALWKGVELILLSLSYNQFEGNIPRQIGNLTLIKYLYLGYNNFIGEIPEEMGYLYNLELLSMVENRLSGSIPNTILNISSLVKISIGNNMLTGKWSNWGNLSNLIDLNLGANEFTGPIPPTIGRLQKLLYMRLADNKLQGSMPNDLCLLRRLFTLESSGNQLSGLMPACIGNLTSLNELDLNSNKLTSTIPTALWSIRYILKLNLSSNSLRGNLPSDISNLKMVTQLDLSNNQLSGDVPSAIGGLQSLVHLSLAHNSLRGPMPPSIGDLIGLELLDLSDNNLSGVIPKSLEKLRYLQNLNVSLNRLQGEIPDQGPFSNFSAQSFLLNDALCGSPRLQVPPCKTRKTHDHLLKYALSATATTILVTAVLLFILMIKCRKGKAKISPEVDFLPSAWRRISHHELGQATNGFCESKLLGKGSFGSVYKGILLDGVSVAIKVFNLQLEEGEFKSFDNECEVLKNIRHRNIIKVISSCSEMDFKALVIVLMPNGSLEKWLYSHNYCLDILQRLNIMIDVALALEYLHHGYSTPVVHCDLKPSNVLLNEDMVAHVGDFGISKILGEGESLARTTTLATVGYMAPEHGTKGTVSTKGDVYSYGIMLMETFTKKKPTDEIFVGEMNLKKWVGDSLHGTMLQVVDLNLLQRGDDQFVAKEQCASSILELALDCSKHSPEERINFKDIVPGLNKIKSTYLAHIIIRDGNLYPVHS